MSVNVNVLSVVIIVLNIATLVIVSENESVMLISRNLLSLLVLALSFVSSFGICFVLGVAPCTIHDTMLLSAIIYLRDSLFDCPPIVC